MFGLRKASRKNESRRIHALTCCFVAQIPDGLGIVFDQPKHAPFEVPEERDQLPGMTPDLFA